MTTFSTSGSAPALNRSCFGVDQVGVARGGVREGHDESWRQAWLLPSVLQLAPET